jgi:hypothetical protein
MREKKYQTRNSQQYSTHFIRVCMFGWIYVVCVLSTTADHALNVSIQPIHILLGEGVRVGSLHLLDDMHI